jgi:transporter family-2 protein
MVGILFAILAGMAISVQSALSARLSEKAGLWLTNAWVHGTGFLVSFIVFLIVRDGQIGKIFTVNKLYLMGGVIGAVILYSVMRGITLLGAAYSVAILLTVQIILSFMIDQYGWFGLEKIPFTWNKIAGIAVLIAGVIVYRWK